MKRTIISIDDTKCTGCGQCVPGCPEGALQIIDGKARLVADYFCDGLGACIGECTEGAITTEIREAEPYDERRVFQNILRQGANVIRAHLAHLFSHGETEFLKTALDECRKQGVEIPDYKMETQHQGCPGETATAVEHTETELTHPDALPELRNWPVQLKLLSPGAPYLDNADILFAADCTAFAYANMHRDFVKNRVCIICCPKLDPYTEEYIEKMTRILTECTINSISVLRMQVPCCGGITRIIDMAKDRSGIDVPVTEQIVTINGTLL